MLTLRVHLFGGLRLFHGETPLPPFPTQKTRSLFAYLATFRDQPHRRAAVAKALWPNTPAARAGRNLNTTLWRLRRTIPPGHIAAQGDYLAFASTEGCWLDTAAFEKLLQEAGLSPEHSLVPAPLPERRLDAVLQAVELYRGDLLEGLDETWSLVEAERLRSRYLEALQQLTAHYCAIDAYETALDHVRRLLAADPLREDAHRQAMDLYLKLGRSGEALAQFEHCRQLLQDELAIAPLPETAALYERIRTGSGRPQQAASLPEPPRPRPLPRTPFDDLGRVPIVGREEEQAALVARLNAAGRGQGGMVLVLGEAGVGKTRLVQEVCQQAESRGWLVLHGNCLDLGEPPPYQGWVQALRPALFSLGPQGLGRVPLTYLAELAVLLPELGRLFPNLPPPARVAPQQRQEQLQRAIGQLLAGLSQEQPLLLLLEDLHWADSATLEALCAITPQLQRQSTLILATARAEEIGPRLHESCQRMAQFENWQRLILARLNVNHTAHMTSVVLGWSFPPPHFVQRLYRETQGNPFFVLEVLKGLFEEGLLTHDRNGQWLAAGESAPEKAAWPLPRGIRQVVLRRLARLDARSRELLTLAAVAGSTVDHETLRQLCGWGEEAFLEASNELLRRQLLLETGERFCFAHEQIRQFLYRGIDPARRRDLHRQVGGMLEQRAPERVEELAFHFYRGQQPGRALTYCMQAGDRAYAVYSTSAALTYFGQAIAAARRLGQAAVRPLLLRAHEQRGQVLEHQGEYEQAAAEYTAMLAVARKAGDTAAVARAIRYNGWLHGYRQEQWEPGLHEARRAYEVAAVAGDPLEKAAALRDIGAYESMLGNHHASLEAHRSALAFAREAGNATEEANILQYIAIGHLFLSQNDQALEVFQQALAIREQLGDLRIAAKVRANIGLLQINRGDFAAAERSLRQAEAGFRETGALPALPLTWIGLATVLRYRGECAASLPILDAAAEVQAGVGSSAYMDALIHMHRGAALWDLGQLDSGLAAVRASVDLARRSNTPTLAVGCLRALGAQLHMLGANAQAEGCHREAWEMAGQAAFARGQIENLTGIGLAALAQGHLSAARQHLTRVMRQARSHGPQMRAEAAAALAELCLAEWRLRPAHALASWALAQAEQMDLRPLQVQSLQLQGQALAGRGHFPAAERALRRALELADPPGYPLVRWKILLQLAHLLAEAGRPAEAICLYEQARAAAAKVLDELKDEDLRRAFASLPGVGALRESGAPLRPGQTRATLARLGAPTGRPLRAGERVTVRWTVDAGNADGAQHEQGGKRLLRRQRLLRLVNEARAQGGDPSEEDLAQALGVSVRTVRSDIAALRAAGRPVRTRGTRG